HHVKQTEDDFSSVAVELEQDDGAYEQQCRVQQNESCSQQVVKNIFDNPYHQPLLTFSFCSVIKLAIARERRLSPVVALRLSMESWYWMRPSKMYTTSDDNSSRSLSMCELMMNNFPFDCSILILSFRISTDTGSR